MQEFNVGDKVRVIGIGDVYTKFTEWVRANVRMSYRYWVCGWEPEVGDSGTIIAKASHPDLPSRMLYGVNILEGCGVRPGHHRTIVIEANSLELEGRPGVPSITDCVPTDEVKTRCLHCGAPAYWGLESAQCSADCPGSRG